jgi:hypothetical protein
MVTRPWSKIAERPRKERWPATPLSSAQVEDILADSSRRRIEIVGRDSLKIHHISS